MITKQITTTQIKTRLEKSFTNVKPLSQFDPNYIFNSPHARTVSVLDIEGLEVMIGCYALTEDIEEGEYERYAYMPQVKQAFRF